MELFGGSSTGMWTTDWLLVCLSRRGQLHFPVTPSELTRSAGDAQRTSISEVVSDSVWVTRRTCDPTSHGTAGNLLGG
jgi:hypothetical protein